MNVFEVEIEKFCLFNLSSQFNSGGKFEIQFLAISLLDFAKNLLDFEIVFFLGFDLIQGASFEIHFCGNILFRFKNECI